MPPKTQKTTRSRKGKEPEGEAEREDYGTHQEQREEERREDSGSQERRNEEEQGTPVQEQSAALNPTLPQGSHSDQGDPVTAVQPNEEGGATEDNNNKEQHVQEERVNDEEHQEGNDNERDEEESEIEDADVETLLRQQREQFAKELAQLKQRQQILHD
ncbi:hypothetical protein KEM55_007031 [Ascosphaera atra]|nr:hypothetical protein KEM55_007031 [Ascosphaera atra]